MTRNPDIISYRTPVVIRATGQIGTVTGVQNSPFHRLLRVGGQWYRPSQLIRADDPERRMR